MIISHKKIKIFRIQNRKGYAAICMDNLTEGKTITQTYERMVKALKRSGITLKTQINDLSELLTNFK
jgi:hypothetical protein